MVFIGRRRPTWTGTWVRFLTSRLTLTVSQGLDRPCSGGDDRLNPRRAAADRRPPGARGIRELGDQSDLAEISQRSGRIVIVMKPVTMVPVVFDAF